MEYPEYNIKTILKEIRARENGPAVDTMENLGMKYNKNFGVLISDLKIIANKYKPNHDLANTLRNKNIRETRLLAEMIEDANLVSEKDAESIVSKIDTIELAEQSCINLFEKLEFAEKKAIEWINSDKEFIITSGFILLSRIALINKSKEDAFFENVFSISEKHSTHPSIFVRKTIARALRQIALRNSNLKTKVLETCKNIKAIKSSLANLVVEEVVPLIDY